MYDCMGRKLFVGATIAYATRVGNVAELKTARVIEVEEKSIKVCTADYSWHQWKVYITKLVYGERIVLCEHSDQVQDKITEFLDRRGL